MITGWTVLRVKIKGFNRFQLLLSVIFNNRHDIYAINLLIYTEVIPL